jgi:hypothetical protein
MSDHGTFDLVEVALRGGTTLRDAKLASDVPYGI